jgi:D-arabinose 1-dehydrogenase-like Zn-dependent alcohol dehydrogenase
LLPRYDIFLTTYLPMHHVLTSIQGLGAPVVTEYPWAKLPEAVQKLREGKVAGRCVVKFDE